MTAPSVAGPPDTAPLSTPVSPGEGSTGEGPADESPPARQGGALRHGLWAAAGRFANVAVTAVSGVLLARLMNLEDFGRFGVAQSMITFLSVVAAFGTGTAGLRLLGEDSVAARPRGATAILAAVGRVAGASHLAVGAAVLGLFAVLGDRLLGAEVGLPAAAALAACVVLRGLVLIASEITRGLGELGAANLLGGATGGPVVNGVFLALCIVAAATDRLTWVSAVALYAVSSGLGVALAVAAMLRWRRAARSGKETVAVAPVPRATATVAEGPPAASYVAHPIPAGPLGRTVAVLGGPLMVAASLSLLTAQLDLMVSGWYLDEAATGLYRAARNLGLLMLIPLGIYNMAVMGHVAPLAAAGRKQELRRVLGVGAAAAAIPTLAIAPFCLFVPRYCLTLLFGPEYAAAAPLLQIVVPGLVVTVLTGNNGVVLSLTGQQRALLLVNAGSAAALAIGGALLSRWYGAVGLATAFTLVCLLQNPVNLYLTRRLCGVHALADFPGLVAAVAGPLRRRLTGGKRSAAGGGSTD